VTKEQSSKVLFKAIKKVNAGDLWFRRDVMKQTIDQLIREKDMPANSVNSDKYALLTDREKEVLESICAGMKNKVIAESLFITETTVRHHLTSIFEKLNVKSRLALAILAFNEGFVEVPKVSSQILDEPIAGRNGGPNPRAGGPG
jgi:DNA-binding NarL/FixJ family response regulator